MNYTDARPTIRSGDLLAFSHGSFKSWREFKTLMVRVFTRSTYSHVGLAWVIGGRVFVLEAVKPKTRIFPLSLSGDFYLIPTNARWSQKTEQFALDHIGVEYSELTATYAYFAPLDPKDLSECAAYARQVLITDGIRLGILARPDSLVKAAQERGHGTYFVSNGGNH